ncbi:unnamed protein product [Mycena citricolor]|uniref:Uncharacterized protein n=1 Tax=Mycena citricolor TaxID=2018698 RepID=A0AAD2K8T4_9AGAR|nr:unnamed protein product [Mycena citricolor]
MTQQTADSASRKPPGPFLVISTPASLRADSPQLSQRAPDRDPDASCRCTDALTCRATGASATEQFHAHRELNAGSFSYVCAPQGAPGGSQAQARPRRRVYRSAGPTAEASGRPGCSVVRVRALASH